MIDYISIIQLVVVVGRPLSNREWSAMGPFRLMGQQLSPV